MWQEVTWNKYIDSKLSLKSTEHQETLNYGVV
jgi:hypothetical protein